jgi:hypothetical protein
MSKSETPRTDVIHELRKDRENLSQYFYMVDHARQLERELTAVTEQREYWANLWADLARGCVKDIAKVEREVVTLTQQRDRLADALQKLADCDWVISLPDRMDAVRTIAREALQSLTTNELTSEKI